MSARTLNPEIVDRLLGRSDDKPTLEDACAAYFVVVGFVPLADGAVSLFVARALAELHERRAGRWAPD